MKTISAKEYMGIMLKKRKHKYNAQPKVIDNIRFDSKAEAEMYTLLKEGKDNKHIDCHVPVTLPGGIRFNIDFLVWTKDGPEVIEVKGIETSDFKTKRKLFDAFHPLAPLKVFQKKGKNWVSL